MEGDEKRREENPSRLLHHTCLSNMETLPPPLMVDVVDPTIVTILQIDLASVSSIGMSRPVVPFSDSVVLSSRLTSVVAMLR